jgi:hypothetical protein
MSATVETPPVPAAAAVSAPPATAPKTLAETAPKVPRYRRIDGRFLAKLTKLDPDKVNSADLPERIAKLGQNVFVEANDVFAPGAIVGFELKAPQRAEAYRATGVVRWLSDEPKGLGVQLFEVLMVNASGADSVPVAASTGAKSRFSLPEPAGVGELLSGLLGKTIEAKPSAKWEPAPDMPAVVAAFGPDDGPTSCLWVFDMNTAIYAGAALTMMPPEEAKQAVQAKELRDGFIENVREIFNVGSSLFNSADGSSVKLKDSYVTSKDIPDSVKQLMASSSGRLDLEIVVPDYGKGNISVIVG